MDGAVSGRRRRQRNAAATAAEDGADDDATSEPAASEAAASDAYSDATSAASATSRRRRRQAPALPPLITENEPGEDEPAVLQSPGSAIPVAAAPAPALGTPGSPETPSQLRRKQPPQTLFMVPANAHLAEHERQLLAEPVRLEKGDRFRGREIHIPVEEPAPIIGHSDATYAEVASTRAFVRISNTPGAAPRRGPTDEAGIHEAFEHAMATSPSGATQGGMLFIGMVLHISQGGLAGACVMQLATMAWPNDASLCPYLAYGRIAVPCQRSLQVLAAFGFLGACDLHAARQRWQTRAMLLLYALVIFTLVASLPTDLAMSIGRTSRYGMLGASLTAAGTNPVLWTPNLLNETKLETGSGAFSTKLSSSQLSLWQSLMLLRTISALLGWAIACSLDSAAAFAVPPLPSAPGFPGSCDASGHAYAYAPAGAPAAAPVGAAPLNVRTGAGAVAPGMYSLSPARRPIHGS